MCTVSSVAWPVEEYSWATAPARCGLPPSPRLKAVSRGRVWWDMVGQKNGLDAGFVALLRQDLRADQISIAAADLTTFAIDQGPVTDYQLPLAVVWAESVADVQAVARAAATIGVPLVTRGAGTGVSGGAHATAGCVVLNLTRMNQILEINPADEIARVEPGVINGELNTAVAVHGLMFARTLQASRFPRLVGTSPRTPEACAAPSTASRAMPCWRWMWCWPTVP